MISVCPSVTKSPWYICTLKRLLKSDKTEHWKSNLSLVDDTIKPPPKKLVGIMFVVDPVMQNNKMATPNAGSGIGT